MEFVPLHEIPRDWSHGAMIYVFLYNTNSSFLSTIEVSYDGLNIDDVALFPSYIRSGHLLRQ